MDSIYSAGFFLKMARDNYYKKCLEEMFSLRRFGIKLGLSTTRNILKAIGNPQNSFSCIHVAGTNGKGSIASALSTILYLSGYKVGLYTSPHLVRFNERICINNRPVSDEDIADAYFSVKNAHSGLREPTFFEFSTAMALLIFGKRKVDWAVIETGMGGRLDATNVIRPKLSIISNISLEHKEYLGNTIAKISYEKAGIIKPRVPVITGVKQKSAAFTLKKIAEKKSAPFYRLGNDFKIRENPDGTFSYFGINNNWSNIKTDLPGAHQFKNASLVLAACEILNQKLTDIPLEVIKSGIEKNKWPGRLEIVLKKPTVILDGAHNIDAVRNLYKYLSVNFKTRPLTMVIGILDDKPYASMLKTLLPLCKKVILTSPKIDRALPAEKLFSFAQKIMTDVKSISDVGEAVFYSIENAMPDDVICVAGSLYVVGEAKEALEKRGIPSFELKT